MENASTKIQVGGRVLSLGVRVDAANGCIDIPPLKTSGLLAEIKALSTDIDFRRSVEREALEGFVGRVSHISVVAPELAHFLRAGYRVLHGKHRFRGKMKYIQLGRETMPGVCDMLQVTATAVAAGIASPWAPATTFPPLGAEGVAGACTDAGRKWGFGGWAVRRETTGGSVALLMTQQWDSDIREALLTDRLSMPAGELLGALAMMLAVRRVNIYDHWVAVTDCLPVAGHLNRSVSASPQIQFILRAALFWLPEVHWLGVHILRGYNQHADDLSKGKASRVEAALQGEGAYVVYLPAPSVIMELARAAMALPGRAT